MSAEAAAPDEPAKGSSLRDQALVASMNSPVPVCLTHISDGESGKEESVRASQTMPNKTKPFIFLVASVAALGGLIFGYDIAGAGATFIMEGFRIHFGWDCASDDPTCVPATSSEIDLDKGLINGLFGIGATFGCLINSYLSEKRGERCL